MTIKIDIPDSVGCLTFGMEFIPLEDSPLSPIARDITLVPGDDVHININVK